MDPVSIGIIAFLVGGGLTLTVERAFFHKTESVELVGELAKLNDGTAKAVENSARAVEAAEAAEVAAQGIRANLTEPDVAAKMCAGVASAPGLEAGTAAVLDYLIAYDGCREFNCWRFSEGDGRATGAERCGKISDELDELMDARALIAAGVDVDLDRVLRGGRR